MLVSGGRSVYGISMLVLAVVDPPQSSAECSLE
jgi:hypothetical protein